MTLRARLAITFAALAAVVALLMGALGYFAVASRITSEWVSVADPMLRLKTGLNGLPPAFWR